MSVAPETRAPSVNAPKTIKKVIKFPGEVLFLKCPNGRVAKTKWYVAYPPFSKEVKLYPLKPDVVDWHYKTKGDKHGYGTFTVPVGSLILTIYSNGPQKQKQYFFATENGIVAAISKSYRKTVKQDGPVRLVKLYDVVKDIDEKITVTVVNGYLVTLGKKRVFHHNFEEALKYFNALSCSI